MAQKFWNFLKDFPSSRVIIWRPKDFIYGLLGILTLKITESDLICIINDQFLLPLNLPNNVKLINQ